MGCRPDCGVPVDCSASHSLMDHMSSSPTDSRTVCQALTALNTTTWHELGVGIGTWQRLAEESVTDYNLMRLAASVSSVIVEKHSKQREATSGADWEMWVGKPGSYLGFRVQAKLLTPESASYESLYRSKATATKQLDDLIVTALAEPWPAYPVYAFYNHRLPLGSGPSASACPNGLDPRTSGWTVASALAVRELIGGSPTKKAAAFERMSCPIQCLLCCTDGCRYNDNAAEGLAPLVERRLRAFWHAESLLPLPALVHEVAPVYVERMFKGERPDDGWADVGLPTPETRFLPDDISRVVLVRDLGPPQG